MRTSGGGFGGRVTSRGGAGADWDGGDRWLEVCCGCGDEIRILLFTFGRGGARLDDDARRVVVLRRSRRGHPAHGSY